MTVKRRLTRIRLDKIAAVDLPCQEHATVAILKRAPTPLSIAKATFQEALTAAQMEGAVSEAFYESFDGLWERNNAFREALTDELAAGGDGSVASEAYVASVKALVDDAVAEARQAGATAADTSGIDKALSAAVDGWLKSKEQETTMKITTKGELQAAVAKFNPETTPVAHLTIIKQAAKDLGAEDELPASGPLAVAKNEPNGDLAKALREIAVLKLSPDARAHFDGLDEAGQTAFLAKSATDQATDIEKARGADPVVYTCKDGTEVRKSAGQLVLTMAKRADEQAEEIAKLRGETAAGAIEKRATEQYPHVAAGTAKAMLKSAQTVGEDTPEGKDILKSLDQMEKAGTRLMKRIGSDEGGDSDGTNDIVKARSTFEGEVQKIKARDGISGHEAMTKARNEHPDLFKAAYPDTAAEAEAREVDAANAE